MSTCERVQAHLNEFLDGTLGAAQAQELNTHLYDCGACRREYRALQTTRDLLRNMATPGGADARQRVMTRFRQTVTQEAERLQSNVPARSTVWRTPMFRFSAAAGVALLLVFMAMPRPRPADERAAHGGESIIIATAACNSTLPTAGDLDEMTSAHAVQSLTIQNGSEESQHEALADANSRLSLDDNR
jgi:anti-sigma factor RsiW